MVVTVLFVALALVAIALVVTAVRIARRAAEETGPSDDLGSGQGVESDGDISEVRRGDRPVPPAAPPDPVPDNLSPFYRPDNRDDRR